MADENLNIKDFLQLKNKIIKSVIKDIFKNKILCSSRNGNILDEQELLDILSNKIEKCIGITINNNIAIQCTKNGIFNGYCKQHNKKYEYKNNTNIYKDSTHNYIEDSTHNYELEIENQDTNEISMKTRKFINDSFYYVDDNFIYSNNISNTKVGYIRNDEYILSDDPFILNC
jgi:hypothetical protein